MANYKKFIVNPYLFLLLKHLLEREFVGTAYPSSNLKLAQSVYDRHKTEKYKSSSFSDPEDQRDSFAYSIALRIHDQLLKSKDFFFSKDLLNYMVAEISLVATFENWDSFAQTFHEDPGTISCERRFMNRPFSELSKEERDTINLWAFDRASKLYFRSRRQPPGFEYDIIRETFEFQIRTPNENEIEKLIPPHPILGSIGVPYILRQWKAWQSSNRFTTYIFRDDFYGSTGFMVLLPLEEEAYNNLKNGIHRLEDVPALKIVQPAQIHSTRFLYIHKLDFFTIRNFKLFMDSFELIVSRLANPESEELVIGLEGNNCLDFCLYEHYLMEESRYGNRIKSGVPFYEIKWQALRDQLTK